MKTGKQSLKNAAIVFIEEFGKHNIHLYFDTYTQDNIVLNGIVTQGYDLFVYLADDRCCVKLLRKNKTVAYSTSAPIMYSISIVNTVVDEIRDII